MSDNLGAAGMEGLSPRKRMLCGLAILTCGFAYWCTRYKASALLPTIAGDLDGLAYYSWASMMFALTGAISAPFWGKMGDIFGKRNILLVLLGLMVVGEVFCAAANNIWLFVVGYAINGFGAGAMQGTYMALLGELFPPTERGKLGGSILSIMSIVSLALPTGAALISDTWSWRYVFVLTGAIFIVAFATVLALVPNVKKANADKRVDILGVLSLSVAVVNFLLAMSWGGSKYAWSSTRIVVMLAAAVVFFTAFILHEHRIPEYAIVSTKLLANRSFLMCCLVSVCMTFGLTGVATFLSLFVQGVMGKTATVFSTVGIPASFIGIFMGAFAGFLMDKTKHYKWMLVLAPAATVLVMLFFGFMPATVSILALIVVRAFYNVTGGSWMPSINSLSAMSYVAEGDYGVGNGTLYFFTAMGNALSPALLGSVLNGSYARRIAASTAALNLDAKQKALVSTARALVNKGTLDKLAATFPDPAAYQAAVASVKDALQMSLRSVFVTAAVFISVGVVAALALKEIPLDQVKYRGGLKRS